MVCFLITYGIGQVGIDMEGRSMGISDEQAYHRSFIFDTYFSWKSCIAAGLQKFCTIFTLHPLKLSGELPSQIHEALHHKLDANDSLK